MKNKMPKLFGCLLISLFCLIGSLQAQNPSILSISQKQISTDKEDTVQVLVVVSQETESVLIEEATFFNANSGASGDAGKAKIMPTKPSPIAGTTSKSSVISVLYGTDKTIQPNYTAVSLKIVPVNASGNGSPYIINLSPPELSKVFQALRDSRSKDDLESEKEKIKGERDKFKESLSKFKPTLNWNVAEGFNALRFEATSTKDVGINIKFNCGNGDNTINLALTANNKTVQDLPPFTKTTQCNFTVAENNSPDDDTQKLLIIPLGGKTTFTTLVDPKTPSLKLNAAKEVKALNKTKVFLPLLISNVTKLEVDLLKKIEGKAPEKITSTPVPLDVSTGCKDKLFVPTGCIEDQTISLPSLDSSEPYQLVVRAYNTDPLRKPEEITVPFNSLPDRFTKSVLVTFTEQGIKFTALTGDVKSKIVVTPFLVTKTDGSKPIPLFSSFNSPGAAIENPSADGNAIQWLADLKTNDKLGETNAKNTEAESPNPSQSATRQLQFDVIVTADDGRVEKSSVTLSVGKSPNKKDGKVKEFVTKIVEGAGGSSDKNPSLSFKTVGGAIASVIGLLIGL